MTPELKKDNKIDFNTIKEMSGNSSYAKLLGLKIEEVTEGRAKISMKLTEELMNPSNSPHGGAILSLADHTCGTAAMTMGYCVGSQSSYNFISSANIGEELIAESWVIHNGRRTRILEVEVKREDGKIVAKGIVTATIIES